MTCRTTRNAAPPIRRGSRVLIYSHDSFGLGHLRRCRAIAQALVAAREDISVLILSGSPIIGSFDFPPRVDFVRVPGVIKLSDGDYQPLNLGLELDETLALRASIIEHTAKAFAPDLFLVDKEPLGLRGEIRPTLEMLRDQGVPCILGLRDVLDDPALLRPEWERKQAMPAVETLYDEIWVYGVERIWDPFAGLEVSDAVRAKMIYTGYLPRIVQLAELEEGESPFGSRRFLLVTGGGGGDAVELMEWVLRAYERAREGLPPAVVNLGPFMPSEQAAAFEARCDAIGDIICVTFDAHIERLMAKAAGVVAMGGYNTFCELLSFDKRGLLIPRTTPRREQLIRAQQAEALGLVRTLRDDGRRDPRVMAEALRALPDQPRPSSVVVPGLLDGLKRVVERVEAILDPAEAERRALP